MSVKKSGMRDTFIVKRKEALTPTYIRVIFDMPDEHLELIEGVIIGGHNKIFIPPPGISEIEFPDREHPVVTPRSPAVRTYTT